MTDDIVIEDVPFVPYGMIMKGKDGVRQGYTFFFEAAPDYKIEPKSWVISYKSFASEWVLTATQKGDFPGILASGKRFSIRGCSFGEFENGKLKRKKRLLGLCIFGKAAISGRVKVAFMNIF